MSDDLREQVADAIEPITGGNITTEQAADAAIAVVIEELANRADAAIMAGVFGRMPLADWLRSQKEAPHE